MSADLRQRFFARSASDRTDDWPFWYVADRRSGNLNVVVALAPELSGRLPFLPRDAAIALADEANRAAGI
jgi:hypothetical protein